MLEALTPPPLVATAVLIPMASPAAFTRGPPELPEHVFDRFLRTDASRSRNSGGSGLGLAIAAAIVKAHGGSITAGSGDGGGTRISVRLPRPEQAAIVEVAGREIHR